MSLDIYAHHPLRATIKDFQSLHVWTLRQMEKPHNVPMLFTKLVVLSKVVEAYQLNKEVEVEL